MQDTQQPHDNHPAPPVPPPSPPTQPHHPYTMPPSQTLGILALIAGISAFFMGLFWFLSVPLGVGAVILGIFSIRKNQGKGMGIAGIVLGALGLVAGLAGIALMVFFINSANNYKTFDDKPASYHTTWDATSAYDGVETGMTKAQAESVMAKKAAKCTANESLTSKTEICTYGNVIEDGTSITITYTNDKVSLKSRY